MISKKRAALDAKIAAEKLQARTEPKKVVHPRDRHDYKATFLNGRGDRQEVSHPDFRPDWVKHNLTAREFEDKFGYEFRGVGWYVTEGKRAAYSGASIKVKDYKDTVLVIPGHVYPGAHDGGQLQVFNVMVWNSHEVFDALNWAQSVGVRLDQRS